LKRLSVFSKLILFLTSYIPLGIISLIIDYQSTTFPFFIHGVYALILLALVVLLPIPLFLFIRHFMRRPAGWESMKIVTVESMDKEILAYIFTYILPFLGFPEGRRVVIGLFLLVIIGILYTRSDMICINPLLAIFGYHILSVEWTKTGAEAKTKAIIISKADYFNIKQAGMVTAVQVYNEIYILKGAQDGQS
jgi:hypothetical protein